MRKYELVVVVRPSLSEENRKKLLGTVKVALKDVKMISEDVWGSKALAYKIKSELTGYYYDFIFESGNPIPSDFEKQLLANENILRHLLVRK